MDTGNLHDYFYNLATQNEQAQLVNADARLSSVHPDFFRIATSTGSYSKNLCFTKLNSKDNNLIVVQSEAGSKTYIFDDSSGEVVESENRSAQLDPLANLPESLKSFFQAAMNSGFTPNITPVSLGDFADAVLEDELTGFIESSERIAAARGRSSFPFQDFEALTSGGALATADAVKGVLALREFLESCSLIAAERWGQLINVDFTKGTSLPLENSPTGFDVFSPEAQILSDWLEIAVRELSEGRGQLVLLVKQAAESCELVMKTDETYSFKEPVKENPWFLFVIDQGKILKYRFKTN